MTPFSSVVAGTTSSMKPFGPLSTEPAGQCSALRILDADVYDTLEVMAEMMGGFGAGSAFDGDNRPLCPHGAGWFACDVGNDGEYVYGGDALIGPVSRALFDVGITGAESDRAVLEINRRRGERYSARVPFELWRQELCIVRGPHPDPSPDATWSD